MWHQGKHGDLINNVKSVYIFHVFFSGWEYSAYGETHSFTEREMNIMLDELKERGVDLDLR